MRNARIYKAGRRRRLRNHYRARYHPPEAPLPPRCPAPRRDGIRVPPFTWPRADPPAEDFTARLPQSVAQQVEPSSRTGPIVIAGGSRTCALGLGLRLSLGLEVSLALSHIGALPAVLYVAVSAPAEHVEDVPAGAGCVGEQRRLPARGSVSLRSPGHDVADLAVPSQVCTRSPCGVRPLLAATVCQGPVVMRWQPVRSVTRPGLFGSRRGHSCPLSGCGVASKLGKVCSF